MELGEIIGGGGEKKIFRSKQGCKCNTFGQGSIWGVTPKRGCHHKSKSDTFSAPKAPKILEKLPLFGGKRRFFMILADFW